MHKVKLTLSPFVEDDTLASDGSITSNATTEFTQGSQLSNITGTDSNYRSLGNIPEQTPTLKQPRRGVKAALPRRSPTMSANIRRPSRK